MAEIGQCTAEQVVDSVEAVTLAGKALTASEIAAFVSHPVPAVERAAAVAMQLGLLTTEDEKFIPNSPYGHYFREASESHRIDVLRFALEAFAPYRFFKQRLAFNSDPARAARETKLKYGFENHEVEIQATLMSLGQFSGSLTYTRETGYSISGSETVDEFLAVAEGLTTAAASVEDFMRERLGADAYAFIQDEQDDIVTHLRGALIRVASDELDEGTVVLIANACENFLVKLADEATPAVNLQGATGIISKAERLHAGHVIAQKQMGYMTFLGQLRNAADHGVDAEINLDWSITPEAIKLGALLLLAGIKSVVALAEGRAEF